MTLERTDNSSYSNNFRVILFVIISALFYSMSTSAEVQHFSSGDRPVTLIELYTSQGCSSCPPAERWMGELKSDPRLWKEIIPVAYHVDYWDYIGWQDSFAKPEYSARQRSYRKEGVLSSVYTPGFVVNGEEWRGWFKQRPLPDGKRYPTQLQLELDGAAVRASYPLLKSHGKKLTLNIVVLGVGLNVDVVRGENSGKRLQQDFVVLEQHQLSSSSGYWEVGLPDIKPPSGGRLALAAWVSDDGSSKPLQAAGGWIKQETDLPHGPLVR
ncbi:MAG: DUF1223 domain-containing protein [Candidatus Sedimenticola sp. (ex Thyasira tokunagai)]